MRKLKLFFACLLMAVLSIGQVWGAPDESVTFSAQGYSNQQAVSSYNGTDFSIAFDKGTNSNAPKYYTSGSAIRAYGGNTMTISSSTKTIKEIAITFGSSDGSNAITTDVATYSNGTWTGSASSVTFTIGGSSGNRRLSAIAITYATGGGNTPSLSVAPTSIDFGTVEQGTTGLEEAVAVTFANLTGSVSYTGLSGAFSATGNISSTGDEITIAANTSNVGEYEQTLTVQSTADALSKTVTVTMNVVEPFDGLELTFPDYNDASVSSYTASWTATKSGQVWDIYGFNNNGNAWSVIKAGRKIGTGSTAQPVDATIATQVVGHAVGDIVVTVDAVTADQITSHKLYVADNSEFTNAIEIDGDPATIAEGNITYTVPEANRANDLYYKLEYATEGTASSNGTLTISKITYAYATATSQKQSTGLAYADELKNHLVKVGASYEAPTLTNPNNLTGIAYASSDANIVSVDASTGALTIKAAGKAVITASRAADDTYKAGSASYTVYVATEAGTAADPLSEASAKALIDLGCTMEAHVHGTVLGAQDATKFTVTLAGGFQFYKLKDLGNVAFESAYIGNGDEVTAVGTLTKYNTTYELADGCYLTSYTEYTEPLVDISNTKETAYTVAQALALAANPTSDLTKAVYIAGVVYDVKSFNSTNGTLDIYIKDAGEDNKFEFYKCAGIYDESLTAFSAEDDVQVGDEVIGYGVMKYYSGGSIWEFDNTATGDYLVELTRPEVAVESVSMTESTAEVEVGSTVTLHASVLPENATNKGINWTVTSGNDKASVADGVVTGVAEGEAVIRAASAADATKYAECTVTVNAADPTKHVVTFDATVDKGESPLSKSNITFTCSSGVLNNESEYRLYKSSTTTFECSVGNITKIEFTGVSGNPVSGFGDPEIGTLVTDGNDGVWTGNAASVSFVASGAQVRATEIKVTYKEDNRAAAGLEWSTDAVVLTVGDAFTAPTLTNPNSIAAGEITIASDNTELAIVTAGVVSLVADATGTATITATFEGNEDYKPAVVSYTITVNEAGLDNVTFDATLDIAGTGELSIAKSGFTLEFTGGALDNGENYRLYKGQTMTLSSTDYYIKKIEFTCTSGNPITGFADAEGLDKDNNQWTGETNSVELTASNAQVRIEKLKVYYIEDTRAASGLEWSAEEVEITLGDAFTAATLQNPNSIAAGEITIASDNENLAEVNEGVVSLVADATGTAHITATFAGNATYKPAKISYTIIVNDPTPTIYVNKLNVNFEAEVGGDVPAAQNITVTLTNVASVTATLGGTNADAFSVSPASLTESGDITISILANTDAAASYAATLTISDGAEGAEDKTINLSFAVTEPVVEDDVTGTWTLVTNATTLAAGKKVIIAQYVEADGAINTMAGQASNNRSVIASTVAGTTLTPAVGTKVMTLADADEGNFYLKTSDGEYLYNASTSSKSYLRTKAEEENVSWTIAVDAEGVATITSVENTNRTKMRYNPNTSGSPLFNCYASGQEDIALYMLEEEEPTPDYGSYNRDGLTAGNYGTICLPQAGTITGATLFEIAYYDETAKKIYLDEVGSIMAAGKPYIFQATATQLNVTYTSGTQVAAGKANGLYGYYDLDNMATDEAAQKNLDENAGNYILYQNAYWLVSGRAAYINNFRAYIKLGEISTTAPEPTPGQAPRRRVAMNVNGTNQATGFENIEASEKPMKLMINGQMYILRGEKMYDAKGQLVK